MRPVPDLLKDWYRPCDMCKGQGCIIKRNRDYDREEAERCPSCGCKGHILTFDGQEAMDWIYRHIKDRLECDARIAKSKRKLAAKPDPEPELTFDPVGLSRYHALSNSILCWLIVGGIVHLAIRCWLGF